jgi:hypothetical protein
MNVSKAIEYAQLISAAYAIPPSDLTNSAGKAITASGTAYTVVTTIYANDLATDMNPARATLQVSIGLVCQANVSGDVVVVIRGTEGILEWIQDAQFLLVPCPFLLGAGKTEAGFTEMYSSLAIGTTPGSPSVASALASLPFTKPVNSMTICGHSLGGALATLLILDVAANTVFTNPTAYTYASPRTGDPQFADTYDQVIKDSFRITNRLDLVPRVPFPPMYEHVHEVQELIPVRLLPLPPKVLVKPTLVCEHSLNTYLYLLSIKAGGAVLPLDPGCEP